MSEYIPKIIHYSWFGRKEKTGLIKRCIETWKNKMPDYEIREWNEDNFDLDSHPFAKEAYESGKYAFVSDYVRLYAVYHYGGIYFDTDIEVKKGFSDKLEDARFVVAFELPDTFMTGFFAAEKGNVVVKEILDYYNELHFRKEDGSLDMKPNPIIFAEKVGKFGLVFNGKYQEIGNGMKIYPNEVFGAYNVYDMIYTITPETVVVHHYTGTWKTWWENVPVNLKKFFLKIFGVENFRKLRKWKHRIVKIARNNREDKDFGRK